MTDGTADMTAVAKMAGAGPRWPRLVLVVLGCAVAVIGTLAVIVATFVLSFDATRAVGVASGFSPDKAWLLPMSVDGAMSVATVVAVLLHLAKRSIVYPLLVVGCGVLFSVVCNAVHARPIVDGVDPAPLELTVGVARVVSAIPALTLALSVHLLMTLVLAVLAPTDRRGRHTAVSQRTPRKRPVAPLADAEVTQTPDSDSEAAPVSAPPRLTVARDKKSRGLEMAAAGATAEEIATELSVSARTAYRYVSEARELAG